MAIIPRDKYFDTSTKYNPNTFNQIWDLINRNMGSASANGLPVIDGENWTIYFDESGGDWNPDVFYLVFRDTTSYNETPPSSPATDNIEIILEDIDSTLFQHLEVYYDGSSIGTLTSPTDTLSIADAWGKSYLFKIVPTYVVSPPTFESMRGKNLFTISARLHTTNGTSVDPNRYSETIFLGTTINRPYVQGITPFTIIHPRTYFIPTGFTDNLEVDYRIYWGDETPSSRDWELLDESGASITNGSVSTDSGTISISGIPYANYEGQVLTLKFTLNGSYETAAYLSVYDNSTTVADLSIYPDNINPSNYQPLFYDGSNNHPYTFYLTTKYSVLGNIDPSDRQFTLELENSGFKLLDGTSLLDTIDEIILVEYFEDGSTSISSYNIGTHPSISGAGLRYIDFYVKLDDEKDYSSSTDPTTTTSFFGVSYNFKLTLSDTSTSPSTDYIDYGVALASIEKCKPVLHLDFIPGGITTGSDIITNLNTFLYDVPRLWGDVEALGFTISESASTTIDHYELRLRKVNPVDDTIKAYYYDDVSSTWDEITNSSEVTVATYTGGLQLRDYIPIKVNATIASTLSMKGSLYAIDTSSNEFLIGDYVADIRSIGAMSSGGSTSIDYPDIDFYMIAGGTTFSLGADTQPYPFYFDILGRGGSGILSIDGTIISAPSSISYTSRSSVVGFNGNSISYRIDGAGTYYLYLEPQDEHYRFAVSNTKQVDGINIAKIDVYDDVTNYRGVIYPYINLPVLYETTFRHNVHSRGIVDEIIYSDTSRIVKIAGSIVNKSDFDDLNIVSGQDIVMGTGTYPDPNATPEQKPVISGVAEVPDSNLYKLSTLSPSGFATILLGESSREIYPNIDILFSFYIDGSGNCSIDSIPDITSVNLVSGDSYHQIVLNSVFSTSTMVEHLNSDNSIVLVQPLFTGYNVTIRDLLFSGGYHTIDGQTNKMYANFSSDGHLNIYHTVEYYWENFTNSNSVFIPAHIIIIGSSYNIISSIGSGGEIT